MVAARVAFVTHGGPDVGMGHVYESLAIAKSLPESVETHFLIPVENRTVDLLKGYGISDVSVISEVPAAFAGLRDFETVVFDLPNLRDDYLMSVNIAAPDMYVVVFGRPGSTVPRQVGDNCDVVVDFAKDLDAFESKRRCEDGTLYLEGPRYFIARPELQPYKQRWEPDGDIGTVLLLFGGSDPSNYTTKAADELLSDCSVELDIVTGPGFSSQETLEQVLSRYDAGRYRRHADVDYIGRLMYESDIVLASPGQTLFEALFVGCPILTVYQNQDQNRIYGEIPFAYSWEDIAGLYEYLKATYEWFTTDPGRSLTVGGGRDEVIQLILGK